MRLSRLQEKHRARRNVVTPEIDLVHARSAREQHRQVKIVPVRKRDVRMVLSQVLGERIHIELMLGALVVELVDR